VLNIASSYGATTDATAADDSSLSLDSATSGSVDYSFAIICGVLGVVALAWWME
jgi:hypothetical protein